jgi:hypothetical protein
MERGGFTNAAPGHRQHTPTPLTGTTALFVMSRWIPLMHSPTIFGNFPSSQPDTSVDKISSELAMAGDWMWQQPRRTSTATATVTAATATATATAIATATATHAKLPQRQRN